MVELSCHGGLTIMKKCIALFLKQVPYLHSRENLQNVLLNGKLGLTEAESVMQLISAQGEQAVKVKRWLVIQGVLEQKIIHIREMLITTAAHLSAWADYPEDDIPQLQP